MIPSTPDDRTPPGEKDVFWKLGDCPDDWTALHALDLAPANRGLRTEIDFVVIIPDAGILCIEVKSHREIKFAGDRWYPHSIRRSPFRQALDAACVFFRRLTDLAPDLRGIPVVHCCIFPRAYFDPGECVSINTWELIDARRFHQLLGGTKFGSALRDTVVQSVAADARIAALNGRMKRHQTERIVDLCLPVARFRPDIRDEVLRREKHLAKLLREQQKPVLQLAERNQRILVTGPAGTGKTLIAMELARRVARKGHRTAMLCYNRLVGDWIRHEMEAGQHAPPQLIAGRGVQVMMRMLGVPAPESPSPAFWEEQLPDLLEERLTDPALNDLASFDYLVLDEAQDFLARPRLWRCLSQLVRGGVVDGRVALFGDLTTQNLAAAELAKQTLAEFEQEARPACWILDENCRNYPIVGETAVCLSGFPHDMYSGYRRSGGSHANYEPYFYKDAAAQEAKLLVWIDELLKGGLHPHDITLLSFCRGEAGVARRLADGGHPFRPAGTSGRQTRFASIYAYKGMENKAIILTDVVITEGNFQRDLFYTGMTRATESVRVLCDIRSMDKLRGWERGRDNCR